MRSFIIVLLLFLSSSLRSQTNDLSSVSTGSFLGFSSLFDDNEKLFGYLAIYFKGKESPTTEKFEYVYFDKNLNKVANNDFIDQSYIRGYDPQINKKGNIELIPRVDSDDYSKAKKQTIATNKIINLTNNTITQKPVLVYENNKLIELDLNLSRKERDNQLTKYLRSNNYMERSEVVELEDGSILVFKYKDDAYKGLKFDYGIIKFDINKNELWRYEFNKDKKSKIEQSVDVSYFDYKSIYLVEKTTMKKDISFKLLKINLENGKKEIDLPIDGYSEKSLESLRLFDNSIDKIYNKRKFGDKIVFVGRLIRSLYSLDEGCFRMIIDSKTNEVKFDNLYYSEIQSYISNIDTGSTTKDSYMFLPRDFYFFEDSSVGIMFEKMKGGGVSIMGIGGGIKTTDLVYLQTNEEFKPKQVKVFEKDKSKGYTSSDYLFSQYINGGNDVAFFYRDYQKDNDGEKNWNLFLNSVKNGVYSQEKIPITSKENSIIPYLAKEGYILLREYNKKSKYNGIRLEKLNY